MWITIAMKRIMCVLFRNLFISAADMDFLLQFNKQCDKIYKVFLTKYTSFVSGGDLPKLAFLKEQEMTGKRRST